MLVHYGMYRSRYQLPIWGIETLRDSLDVAILQTTRRYRFLNRLLKPILFLMKPISDSLLDVSHIRFLLPGSVELARLVAAASSLA